MNDQLLAEEKNKCIVMAFHEMKIREDLVFDKQCSLLCFVNLGDVLVLCDYATFYIPLKNADTETITEKLLTIFSRVGIPQEILTDQG